MTDARILLITDADVFAGTEGHMLSVGSTLRSVGADVRISCPRGSPLDLKATAAHVPVVPIAKRGLLDARAVRTLSSALAAREVDILHAHNGRTLLLSAAAVRVAGRGRTVFTQHFLKPGRLSRRGIRASASRYAHRWVNRQVSHYIAISNAVRDQMISRGDAPADRITVIPNGIGVIDDPSGEQRGTIRAELQIAIDQPLIVCVARLRPEKDVPLLVVAMEEVCRRVPNVRCVIVGEGSEFEAVRALVVLKRLGSHVQMLGFRDDATAVIAASDLLVLPSPAEPFGLVLLEAMSLAKPVVAMRAGGPVEIVDDGINGRLCTPGNAEELTSAMIEILTQPARKLEMGLAGRRRFLERFTAERMALATLGVYENVLGCAGTSAT